MRLTPGAVLSGAIGLLFVAGALLSFLPALARGDPHETEIMLDYAGFIAAPAIPFLLLAVGLAIRGARRGVAAASGTSLLGILVVVTGLVMVALPVLGLMGPSVTPVALLVMAAGGLLLIIDSRRRG